MSKDYDNMIEARQYGGGFTVGEPSAASAKDAAEQADYALLSEEDDCLVTQAPDGDRVVIDVERGTGGYFWAAVA